MALPHVFGPLTGAIPTRFLDDNFNYLYALILAGGGGGSPGSIPTGVCMPFAGAVAPANTLLCFGQAVSRTTYSTLFTVIGTQWGPGDGSTTFNVPDLRGRAWFGLDNMGGVAAGRLNAAAAGGINAVVLGASGGEQDHTMTTAEMVMHTHQFLADNGSFGAFDLDAAGDAIWQTAGGIYLKVFPKATQSAGTSAPFNIVPPGIAGNWVIGT